MKIMRINILLMLIIASLFIWPQLSPYHKDMIRYQFIGFLVEIILIIIYILIRLIILFNPSIHLDSTTTLSDLLANTATVEER